MKRKCLSVVSLLAAVLLLAGALSVAAEPSPDEAAQPYDPGTPVTGTPVIENDRFRLEVDTAFGFFTLTDRETGMEYSSNPPDFQQDTWAQGYSISRLASHLNVRYLGENGAVDQVNSYVGSVSEDGLVITQRDNTLIFTFTFPQQGFVIPVEFSLTDTSLVAMVDYAHVQETTGCRLMEITLLPYFGAAREGDQGGIVLPDGSGMYMEFHNGRFAQGDYVREIYGGDLTQVSETKPNDYKPVLLPMFASLFSYAAPLLQAPAFDESETETETPAPVGREVEAGFVAAIQSGAAGSYVTASVAGVDTGYDTAYFSFLYRTGIETTFLSRTWAEIKRMLLAETACLPENPQVEYRFLSGSEATIRGAAAVYAEMLFEGETGSNESLSDTLYLDVTAGVRTQQQFLGFGYQGITPLTTLEQTEAMLQYLKDNGIEQPILRLQGLDSSGAYYGAIDTKLTVDRRIGTLLELKRLMNDWGNLYPDVQLTEFTRNGNGVWSFFDSVTAVNKKTTKRYDYHYATGMRDYDLPTRYLLRPEKVQTAVKKLQAQLSKQNITAVSPSSLATDLYSNYGGSDNSLGEVQLLFEELIASLADGSDLLLEAPNAYAIPYATALLSMPHTDSGHFIRDGSVPFVQMVLDGYRSYSVPPVNYAADPQVMLLHVIESNSALSYSVMEAAYEAVARTSLNDRYASHFDDWKETIVATVNEWKAVRAHTENSTIADYVFVDKEVRRVRFENGTDIWINYGTAPRTVGTVTIPATSYVLTEGGETP